MDLQKSMERHWYASICSADEIDRILSPQTPRDYLLQQRADIVTNHTRYLRVYLNKARLTPDWSFEASFRDGHYRSVLQRLSAADRELCGAITFGDLFSDDANGYAELHPTWGRIICLNESLQFFMKFCNLALLDFGGQVPDDVRLNALRIALRVMMKKEAMDFFMDPRGQVSADIARRIHAPISQELQFIAGHEFAHHLGGHLDDRRTCRRTVLSLGESGYTKSVYTVSQQQELEADTASILRPAYKNKERCSLLEGALLFLLSLGLVETAQSQMNPMAASCRTHPPAEERFEHLLSAVPAPKRFDSDKIRRLQRRAEELKAWIAEDVAYNYEIYDFYGSVYLAAPDTKWRGRALVDRVDY